MKFICRHTIRSYECDRNGHVNNAVYLNYLEYGRLEFLKSLGLSYSLLLEKGVSLIIARIDIRFRSPALMDEELTIETEPTKKLRTYGVFSQIIRSDRRLVAEGEVTWTSVNSNGRPVPLPPEFSHPALDPSC